MQLTKASPARCPPLRPRAVPAACLHPGAQPGALETVFTLPTSTLQVSVSSHTGGEWLQSGVGRSGRGFWPRPPVHPPLLGTPASESRRGDLGTVSAFSLSTFSLEARSVGAARLLWALRLSCWTLLAGPWARLLTRATAWPQLLLVTACEPRHSEGSLQHPQLCCLCCPCQAPGLNKQEGASRKMQGIDITFHGFKLHHGSLPGAHRAGLVRWMWPALAPSCRGKGGADSQGARLQPRRLPALGRSQGKSFGAKGFVNRGGHCVRRRVSSSGVSSWLEGRDRLRQRGSALQR